VDVVRGADVSEVQIASVFREKASNFNEGTVQIDVGYISDTSATNTEQRVNIISSLWLSHCTD
jgi:hypothetical protein